MPIPYIRDVELNSSDTKVTVDGDGELCITIEVFGGDERDIYIAFEDLKRIYHEAEIHRTAYHLTRGG